MIPRHFKYTQQPHCSQDADAERAVLVEERPDHFEETSGYHLPVSHRHNAQSLHVDINPCCRLNNDLDWSMFLHVRV